MVNYKELIGDELGRFETVEDVNITELGDQIIRTLGEDNIWWCDDPPRCYHYWGKGWEEIVFYLWFWLESEDLLEVIVVVRKEGEGEWRAVVDDARIVAAVKKI